MIMILWIASGVAVAVIGAAMLRKKGESPAVGTQAPDFTLHSQQGQPVSLHDFRGKWVVLYFYPKDFTSGCTVEARNFQRDLEEYEKRNAVILGVSTQDEKSHEGFCAEEKLDFKLLADTRREVSKAYGSEVNLGVTGLSARHSFLIDPGGVVRQAWLTVDVQKHSRDVLAALDNFQSPERR